MGKALLPGLDEGILNSLSKVRVDTVRILPLCLCKTMKDVMKVAVSSVVIFLALKWQLDGGFLDGLKRLCGVGYQKKVLKSALVKTVKSPPAGSSGLQRWSIG